MPDIEEFPVSEIEEFPVDETTPTEPAWKSIARSIASSFVQSPLDMTRTAQQAPELAGKVMEPAVETGGRVLSDFLNRTGIDPSATPGRNIIDIPSIEQRLGPEEMQKLPKAVQALVGFHDAAAGTASGFTEPGQASILPFLGSKPAQALITAQSLASAPEVGRELADAETPSQAAAALTKGAINLGIGTGVSRHLLKKGIQDALQKRSTETLPVAETPGDRQAVVQGVPTPEEPPQTQAEVPTQKDVSKPLPTTEVSYESETHDQAIANVKKSLEGKPRPTRSELFWLYDQEYKRLKALPQVTDATFTNPETGETTTAPNHPEAQLKQGVEPTQPREARETPAFGFEVTKPTGEKEVVSRKEGEEVAREAGQLLEEPKGKEVHSDEIASPVDPSKPLSEVPQPEQQTLKGMGGAIHAEYELTPQTPTGIKNAQVDIERQKRGLPPAMEPVKRSFGEVWDRAMALVDRDPAYQDDLLDSLEKKPRALTDVEDALVLQRQIALQNEYGKATRDLAQAYDDGRTEAADAERVRVSGLSDQLLRLYNLGKKVGTETGRGLAARKMMAYEDYSLAKMTLDLRAAKGGRPLTPEEINEITRLNQKIAETQKAFDDYRADTDRRIAAAETQRIINEGKSSRVPKDASLDDIKKGATAKIKEKVASGEKDKISWYVQQLARAFVRSGIREREPLIDAVHEVLKDAIPDITQRETMDAISGYGDFKQLTKDQISVTLRGMKGEMQQLAKLEDMAKGEPPLKSGVERRTPTEAERKLIKEVNDAKNKFQVPVSDPTVQLKSALDTLKTTLRNRIADYQDRLQRKDFAPRPRREVVLDPEATKLRVEAEKAKKAFQRQVQIERLKNATAVERGANWVTKWRRGFILSGFHTLAKLTAAALQRVAITPAEEAVGGVIGKAIPSVASKAAREGGFSAPIEARALASSITKGMKDAWQTLRTGQSELDILYGKEALLPPTAIDFFGHVHGALKAPTKRAEFTRSLNKRLNHAISNGVDVTDPLVQSRLVIDAYKDANRSIFLQDNRVVDAYKRGLQALERKDKTTGEVPLGGKIAATTARVLLPIVKVPTNIVAETMQYAVGSVTGSARLARAFSRGIENLKPEEADIIMRHLKKGSLGLAVMALGYFNPDVVGGYYQPGEKRKKGDVKVGSIKFYGQNIPSFLLHNPLLETAQIGATMRRVSDSKLNKKDLENQGIGSGVIAGAVGVGEQVPFVREMGEVIKVKDARTRGQFFGELGKSLLVPRFLQEAAEVTDTDAAGNPIARKPRTATEYLKSGVPGLREEVPKKK